VEKIEELTQEFRKMIKKRGGKDITCLEDKEIVKTAFRVLKFKEYDEIVSEAVVLTCDRYKDGWDNVWE
jgi:hypothetical protein